MDKEQLIKLANSLSRYDGERRTITIDKFIDFLNSRIDDLEIAKDIKTATLKEEISYLKAKIFFYEEVIKKSNFQSFIEGNKLLELEGKE